MSHELKNELMFQLHSPGHLNSTRNLHDISPPIPHRGKGLRGNQPLEREVPEEQPPRHDAADARSAATAASSRQGHSTEIRATCDCLKEEDEERAVEHSPTLITGCKRYLSRLPSSPRRPAAGRFPAARLRSGAAGRKAQCTVRIHPAAKST